MNQFHRDVHVERSTPGSFSGYYRKNAGERQWAVVTIDTSGTLAVERVVAGDAWQRFSRLEKRESERGRGALPLVPAGKVRSSTQGMSVFLMILAYETDERLLIIDRCSLGRNVNILLEQLVQVLKIPAWAFRTK